MKKWNGAPMTDFFLASTTLLSAVLCHFRWLPGLQADTLFMSGKPHPAAEVVHRCVLVMLLLSVPFLVSGFVGLATMNESRRRHIASLARWQQWLIWPFHGVVPADPRKSQEPPPSRA